MSRLWGCMICIGVSLFTPVACTELAIDFLTVIFPGTQVVTKAIASYTVTFLPLQILFHLHPNCLPISRHVRIKLRYILVTCLMASMIAWERLMVGSASVPLDLAANTLLAIITLIGFSDGLAVAAVYGEVAVLGASAAHALVVGASAVMPLLSALRITFKAALPNTTEGLRLSLVEFYAAAVAMQLIGLACYWLYALPAVTAVFAGAEDSKLRDAMGSMILVPSLLRADGQTLDQAGRHDLGTLDTRSGITSPRSATVLGLAHSLSLPSSMRGNSLLVRRVHSELPTSVLRTGAIAASFVLKDVGPSSSTWWQQKLQTSMPGSELQVDCSTQHTAGGEVTNQANSKAAAAQQHDVAPAVVMDIGTSPFATAAAAAAVPPAAVVQPGPQASAAEPAAAVVQPGPQASAAVPAAAVVQPGPQASAAEPAAAVVQPGPQASAAVPAAAVVQPGPQASAAEPAAAVVQPGPQASAAEPAAAVVQPGPQASAAVPAAAVVQPGPQASAAVPAAAVVQPGPQASGCIFTLQGPHAGASKQLQHPSRCSMSVSSWPSGAVLHPTGMALNTPSVPSLARQGSVGISLRKLSSAQTSGEVGVVLQELLDQVNARQPAQSKYFSSGLSLLAANWAMMKDNAMYCVAMMLCYVVNYGIYPAFVAYVKEEPALGTWYLLLLATTYGLCDLLGKLNPVWKPQRPQLTVVGIAVARAALFFPVFAVGLWMGAGPWFFFPALGVMALTTWFEVMIFCLATEGHHPDDAFQIEAALAILLNIGAAIGTALSFCWTVGPWASKP